MQGPTSIKLDGRAYVVLGRSGDADVRLEGKLCSRKHASIGYDAHKEHVYLTDLNSAHGTFIDEKRIEPSEKKRLKVGQEIWFGNSDGEPRYTVHAVCSRKRAREDDDGGKSTTRPRTDAHAAPPAPHSAAHARHGDDPTANSAQDTLFWKNGGSNGQNGTGDAKGHTKEDKTPKDPKPSEKDAQNTRTGSGADACFCHVMLRHSSSTPANPKLHAADAKVRANPAAQP